METYHELDKRQREELNEFEGLFFAFSNKQLEEGMLKVGLKEDDYSAIVSIGAGGYLRKDRAQAFKDMFARHEEEKARMRKEQKTIKIKFKGIDGWNRPVFKSIEKPFTYYGSVDTLFDLDATEEEVLSKISEDCLCYFGNSFGCEPMGTASGNIEIVK